MNKLTICLFVGMLGMSIQGFSQQAVDWDALWEKYNQNYTGSLFDVFTAEEIQILRDHLIPFNTPPTEHIGTEVRLYGPENVTANFGWIDTNDPSKVHIVNTSQTADFDGAGTVVAPGSKIAYTIDNAGNLYEVSLDTGIYTFITLVTPPPGENFTGLEIDPNSGDLYGISTDGVNNMSTISTINFETGEVTPIGNTGLMVPICLGIDGDGGFYTLDIDDDKLYTINPANGAATEVGDVNFDANFGQGMAWDPTTSTMFLTALNYTILDGELRTVNTSTGATTLVGNIDPDATRQMAWAGIRKPALSVSENIWKQVRLGPNPSNGNLSINSPEPIDEVRIFNALGAELSVYQPRQSNWSVDMGSLASGIYFIKVSVGKESRVYKWIRQ